MNQPVHRLRLLFCVAACSALLVACEVTSMSVGARVAMTRADGEVEPSKGRHVAVVRALLDAGASVEAKRMDGSTALLLACDAMSGRN